ncbi:MAG: hypothetical protein KGN80_09770, partial [Acidobacteriota bacterium]|nr:hypothetical protein [Acidobacteriota bacterium]
TTTVPGFTMVEGANNSTLPVSYANDAQVSMAQGSLSSSQNHHWNVDIGTDAALFGGSWSRNQWGLAAPTVGYQPAGTNNVRLVNPKFDSAVPARWNNTIGAFRALGLGAVSTDGGVRDSAIVYGVRRHTDENSGANKELGLAGIEPGSPMLAQWYNLQETNDAVLDESRINNTGMSNVVAWPKVFTFYSPFGTVANNPDWANVMEFKVNYLVGMRYPDSLASAPANTLWKVPATMANAFELGQPVTDDMSPANTLNPGNPIVRPIQFLRISDFKNNTAPGAVLSTLDLATSDPTNSFTGAGALNPTGIGTTWIQSRSNVRLTWQSSVNNQVIPSGYIVEVFQLTGTATTTNQPTLLATVRAGHIGGKDAIQKLYLPSMHSFSGLDGNAAPNNAVYFFKVRTVWNKGINFEKQPTKQSIPSAYADYVSAPFVAHN